MTAELVPVEVLAYHGLKPDDRMAGLMILLAARYQLDPLAGHLEVIKTRSGPRLYITRDGYLIFGHRSGVLDGIVVEDLHHGETGWSATVSVWRRDMRFPFTYSAGCGDKEPQAMQGDGEAMALARAERRALKRAFPVIAGVERAHDLGGSDEVARDPLAGVDLPEGLSAETRAAVRAQLNAEAASIGVVEDPPTPEPGGPVDPDTPRTVTVDWTPGPRDQTEAHRAIALLREAERDLFLRQWTIGDFGEVWPAGAVADALGIDVEAES